MATRYVWSKYNRKSTTSEEVVSYVTKLTYSSDTEHHLMATSATVSDGKFSPSGSTSKASRAGTSIGSTKLYGYVFKSGTYPATYVYRGKTKSDSQAWYGAEDALYTSAYGTNASVTTSGIEKVQSVTTYSKGAASYGYVSNSSSSYYPSNYYSGSYWYVYAGSDCIDPTKVTLSNTNPKAGESVTITATKRSNTYGGTISYRYQYSVNGGSTWTTITTTTATSTTVTVPDGAEQFQARVRASDNYGFTSSTYVYTDNIEVGGGGIGSVYVDGAIREGAFHACVDGVIKTDFAILACVDGVIKECS